MRAVLPQDRTASGAGRHVAATAAAAVRRYLPIYNLLGSQFRRYLGASRRQSADLSESGWQDAISSIQVQSGTWDFFTDDDFGGNTMRLATGTYPMLTPDWDKKINSFMCVQPGAGS